MAEADMSTNSADAGAARQPGTQDVPSRPVHDRELPVTASEGDMAAGHRAVANGPDAGAEGAATNAEPRSEAAGPDPDASALGEPLTEDQVKLALRRVKDPELNLNILDLGLVYEIRVDGNDVSIDMTLTSPGCPSGPEIMTDAERHLKELPGVRNVAVNLVWSPFWSPERIEPRVRAYLGF
jgi:metal-sulfur cluster biosynthetic enzyme